MAIIIVIGCREPFDFDYDDDVNSQVVIDGYISDLAKSHTVRVSRSTTINDRGLVETQFVNDAQVRVEDDQGGSITFFNTASGYYESPPNYSAQEGLSYRVVVTLASGEEYNTEFTPLPERGAAVADLSFSGELQDVLMNNSVQQEEGAAIFATINKGDTKSYYQWRIGHYFVGEADLALSNEIRFCYLRDFDEPRIVLLEDNPLLAGQPDEFTYQIDFIPISAQMEHEFGVEGILLTMSEEDFAFWDDVKTQTENSGGLFDAAPFTLVGNIRNTGTGESGLGYFGVYRESIDRVFFVQGELGFRNRVFPPCTVPPFAPQPNSCQDCRAFEFQENFGTQPPVWWGN